MVGVAFYKKTEKVLSMAEHLAPVVPPLRCNLEISQRVLIPKTEKVGISKFSRGDLGAQSLVTRTQPGQTQQGSYVRLPVQVGVCPILLMLALDRVVRRNHWGNSSVYCDLDL